MADRTIYIGNLPSYVDEAQLVTFFSVCGAITQVKLAGDPSQPTRFGFVEFASPQFSAASMQLNGYDIGGKRIKVQPSKSPINGTQVHGGQLMTNPYAAAASSHGANPYQMSYAQVMNPWGVPQYVMPYAAAAAPAPRATVKDPARAAAEAELIPRTVYISRVDKAITEAQLLEFFSVCGTVTHCRVCGDVNAYSTRFAFVEFDTLEAANAAIQLNGIQLGSEPLKITASNSAIASSVQAKINSSSIPEERKDSIKRTIYVGSVDVTLTEAELKHHFEVYVGPVVRAVLAGDKVHETRFAFLELETEELARKALTLSGTYLKRFPIQVSMSTSPILVDHTTGAPVTQDSNPSQGTVSSSTQVRDQASILAQQHEEYLRAKGGEKGRDTAGEEDEDSSGRRRRNRSRSASPSSDRDEAEPPMKRAKEENKDKAAEEDEEEEEED